MDHLGQSPGPEGGHQHRRPKPDVLCGGQVQAFGRLGDGLQPGGQPSHLIAADHRRDQGDNPRQHDNPLYEIGPQGGGVSAQDHDRRRGQSNDHHAYPFIHLQQHRAHTGQALVNRGGIGKQEDKDHGHAEALDPPAAKALFKKLGHGLDFEAACGLSRPPGQNQPGQQGADQGVSDTGQYGPQAIVPAGFPGVADKHDGGKIRGAVGKGRHPGPGIPPAHRKVGDGFGLAAGEDSDRQNENGVNRNGDPDHQLFGHSFHPSTLYHFKPLRFKVDMYIIPERQKICKRAAKKISDFFDLPPPLSFFRNLWYIKTGFAPVNDVFGGGSGIYQRGMKA